MPRVREILRGINSGLIAFHVASELREISVWSGCGLRSQSVQFTVANIILFLSLDTKRIPVSCFFSFLTLV